jgi:hypothetical protein
MDSEATSRSRTINRYLLAWFDRLLEAETGGTPEPLPKAWCVVRTIAHRASKRNWSAFLIGGAIRDLVLGGAAKTPRDFDIVLCNATQAEIAAEFSDLPLVRRTRLGGLRYDCGEVFVDIWPLEETFAVRNKKAVKIQDVTKHAFLDLEAVAVEISLGMGKPRQIIENGFTRAVLTRTLEVNYEQNPFPEVCVVKAIRTATGLTLFMGDSLVEYIRSRDWDLNALVEAQKYHYGDIFLNEFQLRDVLEIVSGWNGKNGKLSLNSLISQRGPKEELSLRGILS